MAAVYDTEQALATFRCGGLDPNLFLLTSWRGTEAVSRLYKFDVELASADDNIDLENLLGRRATLALTNQQGEVIPWHGIVTAIKQTKRDETYAYYAATLEPQLALLRLFRQSRVYMHASQNSGGEPDLADVIRMVLDQVGLSQEGEPSPNYSPDYAIRIPSSDLSETRSNFICQFEETSLDFLQRRLEHQGVYFWFEQGQDKEVVVFGNQKGQQPSDDIDVFWRDSGEINPETDKIAITRFDHQMRVQPKSVVLREFSLKQPSLDLTVNADVNPAADSPLDRFDGLGSIEVYGSHYSKQDQGNRIARLRAEELACTRNSYKGESTTPGIRAGYSINLQEHFRDDVNAKYYVIEVQHEGSQSLPRQATAADNEKPYYNAVFGVIPADVQYRPARITRKPRIIGFLSAIVEAEGDGEYAEMNEYGCYRIRFLFAPPGSGQQGEANSAWVRMATPYAGSQHGLNLPLLKGTEVLVSFLGGNPDRPIIVSAIPNEENPSIRNQDNATQPALQTAGLNALNFEDKKDAEFARLSSPKAQSTLHLGNDPDKPEATGIRMATVGHMGNTSTSYIQQVPGIYSLEIGTEGQVAKDPVQNKAVKKALSEKKANDLMQQALMPNAEPAVQMAALEAQQAMAAAGLGFVQQSIANAQNANPKNNDLLAALQAQLSQSQDQAKAVADLMASVASGNKSAQQAVQELADSQPDDTDNDSPPAEDKESGKKDEPNPNTQFNKAVKNEMAYGATNSIMLGATNTIACGPSSLFSLGVPSLSVFGGIALSVNEALLKEFRIAGQKSLGTYYFFKAVERRETVANLDVGAVKYKLKSTNATFNTATYSVNSGVTNFNGNTYSLNATKHINQKAPNINLKAAIAGSLKAGANGVSVNQGGVQVRGHFIELG